MSTGAVPPAARHAASSFAANSPAGSDSSYTRALEEVAGQRGLRQHDELRRCGRSGHELREDGAQRREVAGKVAFARLELDDRDVEGHRAIASGRAATIFSTSSSAG